MSRDAGRPDVVVVGAGLAGLTCALTLHAAGREVLVLEAGDQVGGRIRTDAVDGYRLDRGFQVLLTGYPAARHWFDLDALDLRPFAPGVVIRHRGRFRRLADPLRAPVAAATSVLSPLPGIADGLRLLAWRASLVRASGPEVAAREQITTVALLHDRGFSPAMVAGFFSPFLAGTFFDPGMTTSSRVTELVFRSFFRGEVAVPALGMQQLPLQLAAQLPLGTIRLQSTVTAVGIGEVVLEDGDRIAAEHVVVATEGPAAARLLDARLPGGVAPDRGTTTVYYRTGEPPITRPDLVLDADGQGPVTTLAVMSAVADTYAPDGGQALVSVSTVGVPPEGDRALDEAIRRQLRPWYGAPVDDWERIAAYRIPHAQPRQDPEDLPTLAREVRVDARTWVCGDHRDTSSIQGALVSGRRTARALLAS
ncbi:MAG: NAD(P)/FAD-dependent oxidoreductase [Nitriliruptoraceae bacterium]